MNYDITSSFIKLFIGLPLVIFLAYISLKFTNKYMRKMNDGKYLKVLETVQIFNKAAICIIKIGDKYHVIGVTDTSINEIKILNEDEANAFINSSEKFDYTLKRIMNAK